MSFLDELQKNTNFTTTENGAKTHRSSLNYNLDFFSLAGAMRDNQDDAVQLFTQAFHTDKLTALKTLFYLRDIRGGQGERELFRVCYKKLFELDKDTANKLIEHIPEYGRWDDIIAVSGVSERAAEVIKTQLHKDIEALDNGDGDAVSLLAKWLPSENASSKQSRSEALQLAKLLGFSIKTYRKALSKLRKHIKLLEHKMSNREWSNVEYSHLPSQAHRKHTKAFKRHDEERYMDFLDKAQKGEVKLNTSTLYTYEVFDAVRSGNTGAANAMWANLPDYTNGTDALVVADVSGSMTGRPMSVSVSLALYFAEHNKGVFHNKFMTFSEHPQVVDVIGNTLRDKLSMIQSADWGMNTDLEATFDAILQAGQGSSQDEMPKVLYIISDMQFDQATTADETLFENAKRKFNEAGLELPHVVFWNVDARDMQSPATKFDNRVTLISGLSQSIFKYAVEGKTPLELMNDVIGSERYTRITL